MFCRGLLGYGYSRFGGGGGVFPMMILGFLILLALFFLVFKAFKVNSHSYLSNSSNCQLNDSALKILNERYAKGEINEEEYTKMKILISNKN